MKFWWKYALLAGFVPAGLSAANAGAVSETVLTPATITDVEGTHAGSVAALTDKDQRGRSNDPEKWVQFGKTSGEQYRGYRSYYLPESVNPAHITTLTLIANVYAPSAQTDTFSWSIYNWQRGAYEDLGTQNNCGGVTGRFKCSADLHAFAAWKWLQYTVVGRPLTDYIDPATRELRVQLRSANASSYLKMDYESLSVYSNLGAAGALWIPPVNTRWQWQIQARAGAFASTNGINVDICMKPFRGSSCVKPDVFDIDLYEDSSITQTWDGNTVSDDYVFSRDAVRAIHDSGRKVIAYITIGDAENWRADFQQMVDFDTACNRCFLGKAFSNIFPDEWYVNINNDQGQADFMRKIVQARIDKAAASEFDSLEPDVDFAAGNQSGFTISDATQVAYNVSIAGIAHQDGLSINLKSDVDEAQNPQLIAAFDYVIDEQCFQYKQCDGYAGFQAAGKAIFNAEYKLAPAAFCPQANALNFNSIKKAANFDLYDKPYTPCR